MDIKDLNKTQLILLALLLSFVTSIATGITTVTLLQQAPPSVTVPINRVVRETVEKIQQVEGKTTIQTVVVKEEDLVVDSIEKNKSAVFAVSKEDENNLEVSAGRGFVVSDDGTIVADSLLVAGEGTYYLNNSNGKFKAEFISKDVGGFSFLKIGPPIDPANKIVFTKPTFGDVNNMKAGQKIIIFGSTISSFIFDGDKNIKVGVGASNAGALLLNLDGEALGVVLSGEIISFVPIDSIISSLKLKDIPEVQ